MSLRDSDLFQRLRFRARASKYARRVDPGEIRFFRALLRPGDLAIDVGAHKGGYLYWLQKAVAPSGHVLAFEPQRAAAAYLEHVKDICRFDHVEILNRAVSDTAGTVSLFAPSSRVSTGATLVPGLFPENDATDQVEAVTLDGLLATRPDLPAPRFIKIDVETHELAVLRGARNTLVLAKPVVQFEADQYVYGARPIAELFEFLAPLGLGGFFFFERSLHPLKEFDVARHQSERWRAIPNHPGYANNFLFMSVKREARLLRRYGILTG
jgi:FkbM family methyltransferase